MNNKITSYSQINQDLFVLMMTKLKKNGYFIELGSNDPEFINNTFILEKYYGWQGIMIDISDKFLSEYKYKRPNSIYIIDDATKIDYVDLFSKNNVPNNIDYLQLDLEPDNESTINVLKYFDKYIFDNYKFATITFEHDIYKARTLENGISNPIFHYTRNKSREILENHGYIRVFSDVSNKFENNYDWPFEDWYIHPDLIDINYVNEIIEKNKNNYIEYNKPDNVYLKLDKIIYYHDIKY